MKKIILLLMLCIGTLCAHAQQYFNERYTLHSISSKLTSVIVHNGKYYCTGYGNDSVNYQAPPGYTYSILGLRFSVFDESGHVIRDTVWQKHRRQLFCPPNVLYHLNDGSFLTAMDGQDTSGSSYMIIACLDSMGNHLWDKEYTNPFCLADTGKFLRVTDFKPTGTHEWLLAATINCSEGISGDIVLTKLDSTFNIIWQRKYGVPNNVEYNARLLIEADGYVIGYGESNFNRVLNNYTYLARMIRIDTAGNEQWAWRSNTARKTNGLNDLIRTVGSPEVGRFESRDYF